MGLDSSLEKIPSYLLKRDKPLFEFNKEIVNATADLACAYKPQIAFYAASRSEDELEMTIEYIHETYPEIPTNSFIDSRMEPSSSTIKIFGAIFCCLVPFQ